MTRWAVAALLLLACSKDEPSKATNDPIPATDAGFDAAADPGTTKVAPCLDRPADTPRPPSGALPCEMLPPGFAR